MWLDEMDHEQTVLRVIEDVTLKYELSFPVTDGRDASMDSQG